MSSTDTARSGSSFPRWYFKAHHATDLRADLPASDFPSSSRAAVQKDDLAEKNANLIGMLAVQGFSADASVLSVRHAVEGISRRKVLKVSISYRTQVSSATLLRARYHISGNDRPYGATRPTAPPVLLPHARSVFRTPDLVLTSAVLLQSWRMYWRALVPHASTVRPTRVLSDPRH